MTTAAATTVKAFSTAAPPLNVYKKVAVIRCSSDTLTFEDAEGIPKIVSIQELGDAIATAIPLEIPKMKLDIPVPRIHNVRNYERDVPPNFRIPLSYIRHHKRTNKEWNKSLEYVADREDELWLIAYYKKHKCNKLSLNLFEPMINLLETSTAFDAIITTQQAERLYQSQLPLLYATFPNTNKANANEGIIALTVEHVIRDVYAYWVQKRSKLKRPLLRRFWPVTSTDDTNPHMVFRPRAQEKYKLRKKRQNDTPAYRKLKQLRDDFDTLRSILHLVRLREQLQRQKVVLLKEQFDHRLYECINTTGLSRPSLASRTPERWYQIQQLTVVPRYFDMHVGGRSFKVSNKHPPLETTTGGAMVASSHTQQSTSLAISSRAPSRNGTAGTFGSGVSTAIVAGRNGGEPAPHFLHPLPTRQTWVNDYANHIPHIATRSNDYINVPFRHRPRVGRGGRVCIDRVPILPAASTADVTTMALMPTVYTAGRPLPRYTCTKRRLLELRTRQPLDHATLSRRVETVAVAALKEDHNNVAADNADSEDAAQDGQEVIVSLQDWLDTDDPLWGEERFAIVPM